MISARYFDILWQGITAIILFLIAFRLTESYKLSFLPSIIYLFLYFRQDYWHTLQADGSLNLFFCLTIYLLIKFYFDHSFLVLFASAIFFGIALLFKYTIILFLPLLLIGLLIDKKFIKTLRYKNAAIFLLGILIVIFLVVLRYYFAGALNELIDIQFVQTPLYTKIAYETVSFKFIINHIIKLLLYSAYSPLIWLSLFYIIFVLYNKEYTFPNFILIFWIFSSLTSLIIQWKFYNYHFLVIIPPLAIGTAMGLFYLQKLISNKFVYNIGITIYLLIFFILSIKPYINNYYNLYSLLNSSKSLNDLYSENGITTDSVFMIRKTFAAIEKVNKKTEPKDKIYVWGFDPLIYYLSDRECVSRFIYNFPLIWKGENAKFRTEFMNALEKEKPKIIIVASNDPIYYISGFQEDSKQALNRFPEFAEYINNNYVKAETVVDYEFYELKNW
jgi:hypothetical protein